MIGERQDILEESNYGDLVMRSYDIENNEINAFYDDNDDLVFVVDNTITEKKPNVLLVINPEGDKKWDEILSNQYNVDLETIRPKVDNKYQKLDIEYSGLNVYENLINAFVAGDDIEEELNQLNILRDSAARHSAMMRLNVANDIISKTNLTIVKTKEVIIRLQERLKTLRSKLTQQKKEIGRVPTKQSASKILKIESQIEATNEKIKRAKKRLESAQRRLEVATVDAELASDVLNQPETEIVKTTPKNTAVRVAPKHEVQKVVQDEEVEEYDNDDNEIEEDIEEYEESEIKPLFDKDPKILNEDIAFKPITFDKPMMVEEEKTPALPPLEEKEDIIVKPITEIEIPSFESQNVETPDFEAPSFETPSVEKEEPKIVEQNSVEKNLELQPPRPIIPESKELEQKPVLETFTPMPLAQEDEHITQNMDVIMEQEEQKPIEDIARPVSPMPQIEPRPEPQTLQSYNDIMPQEQRSKPSFIYYVLLLALVALSVFTLWLYQQNMGKSSPMLVAQPTETVVEEKKVEQPAPQKVEEQPVVQDVVVDADEVFLDVVEPKTETEETQTEEAEEETTENQPVEEETEVEPETTSVEEVEAEAEEPVAPVVLDDIPTNVMTSGILVEEATTEEEPADVSAEEAEVDKPEYAVAPDDNLFVSEQDVVEETAEQPVEESVGFEDQTDVIESEDNPFIDEEEAAYQQEQEDYEE